MTTILRSVADRGGGTVPAASVPRRAAKKAEDAWICAVRALQQGQNDAAARYFEEAVRHDPTAADAWLGLHATGRRQKEALEGMNRNAANFGVLRNKFGMPVKSRFQIGYYVTFRLENARDLWLATMTELLDTQKLDVAWANLSEAMLDCDETRFVCTRYAFLKRDWSSVLTFARDIQDAFFRDESQLYVAIALINQRVFREALNVLAPLPQRLEAGGRFEAEVAYFRGRVLEEFGNADDALEHYQYAYRLVPGLLDVAERAQARVATTTTATTTAATAEADPAPAPDAPPAREEGTAGSLSAEQRADLLAEAQQSLDGMIGLEPVKRQVRTLIAQLRMAALRAEQGLPSAARPQHFVFAGPPGTGKTTVARIIGKVFAGLDLLDRGHVVESQRVDLVGQHLGSTAIKTGQRIDSALDGVLFIDEAYALSNSGYSGGDAFGDEALQVLLKRAEDDRDRLMVVLAGYRDEMGELIAANPGLASRFTTWVNFPSYSVPELVAIAESMLVGQGDTLSPDGNAALEECFTAAAESDLTDKLGNGRFARELCQKATAQRDLRLAAVYEQGGTLTREHITTVLGEDIAAAYRELVGPY
ncbi:AAA family ATPase [Streptomyces sp. NPDC048638]|uniref:AAA family ATPase n=1 Tax=Streptomyces sp. NPDC048638 TaxID=3365580 RepID=UPI003720D7F2